MRWRGSFLTVVFVLLSLASAHVESDPLCHIRSRLNDGGSSWDIAGLHAQNSQLQAELSAFMDLPRVMKGRDRLRSSSTVAVDPVHYIRPIPGLYDSDRLVYVAGSGGYSNATFCGTLQAPCSSIALGYGLSDHVLLLPGDHIVDDVIGLSSRRNVTLTGVTAEGEMWPQGSDPCASAPSIVQQGGANRLAQWDQLRSVTIEFVQVSDWVSCLGTSDTAPCRGAFYLSSNREVTFKRSCFQRNGVSPSPVSFKLSSGSVVTSIADSMSDPLTFSECVFVHNSVRSPSTGQGGAIAMSTGTLFIASCSFIGNSVSVFLGKDYAYGGAVFAEGQLSIQDSLFEGNFVEAVAQLTRICPVAGGAVYHNGDLVLNPGQLDCSIRSSNFTANFVNGTLANTHAFGGALAAEGGNAEWVDSVFVYNSVVGAPRSAVGAIGGATFWNGIVVTVDSCMMSGNNIFLQSIAAGGCFGLGGGMYLVTQAGPQYPASTITGTTFMENNIRAPLTGSQAIFNGMASQAAGLFAFSYKLAVVDCLFLGCSLFGGASSHGSGGVGVGAGAFFFGEEGIVTVADTNFIGNEVESGKGAYASAAAIGGGCATTLNSTFTYCSFRTNSAFGGDVGTIAVGTTTPGNGIGGAVASLDAPLWLNTCTFHTNQARGGDQRQIAGDPLQSGAAGWGKGGAVFAAHDLFVDSCLFEGNLAIGGRGEGSTALGAAVLASVNGIGTVTNSTFTSNVGTTSDVFARSSYVIGAAVACTSSSGEAVLTRYEFNDCSFANNEAIAAFSYGGALAHSSSHVSLSDCRFSENSAGGYITAAGGCIISTGSVSMSNCSLVDSTAVDPFESSRGGAIYLPGDASLAGIFADIVGNYAYYGGGIFVATVSAQTTDIVIPASLSGNGALGGGGVFFASVDGEKRLLTCSSPSSGDNNAAYGSLCGSGGRDLSFVEAPPDAVWPGEAFPTALAVTDWFGSQCTQHLFSVVANPDKLPNILSGVPQDIVSPDEEGTYEYPSVEVIGTPGTSVPLDFATIRLEYSENGENFNTSRVTVVQDCPPAFSFFSDVCLPCEEANYNFNNQPCTSCPVSGQECLLYEDGQTREFQILPGYYPSSFENPSFLSQCPVASSCPGYTCVLQVVEDGSSAWDVLCDQCDSSDTGGLDCHCADGYTGRLCSDCVFTEEVCYYRSGGECHDPNDLPFGLWMPFAEMLLYLGLAIVWFSLRQDAELGTSKTLVFFVQTSAVFSGDVVWRYGLVNLLAAISSGMVLNFLNISSLRCLSHSLFSNDVANTVYLAMLPTFVVLPCVLVVLAIKAAYREYRRRRASRTSAAPFGGVINDPSMEPLVMLHDSTVTVSVSSGSPASSVSGESITWRRELQQDAVHSGLYIVYASFFGVCNLAFSAWGCAKSENGDAFYALNRPWLECSVHTEWIWLFVVSMMLLVVYALIPFFFFAYLLFARDLDAPENLRQYGFLYESYRREVYWWELVAMARKLLLAFSAAALNQGHALYYALPVAVICASAALQIQFLPYHSKKENLLEFIGSAIILLSFQTGQYMSASLSDLDVSQWVSEILVLACNGVFVVYMLWRLANEIRLEYKDKARRYYGQFVVGVSRLLSNTAMSRAFSVFHEEPVKAKDMKPDNPFSTIDPL